MTTSDSQSGAGGKPSLGDGLGLIEKAWEWSWALRFASIVLFLDIALILRGRHGILAWSGGAGDPLQNAGFLAVAATVFGLIAAILVPLLSTVVQQILFSLLGDLLVWFRARNDRRYTRPRGHVLSHLLHERALRDNSDFMLKLYEEHCAQEAAERRLRAKLGNLVFGAFCLAVADGLMPYIGASDSSLIILAMQAPGESGTYAAWMVAFGCAVMLKFAWFPDLPLSYIYYPPLADELYAKDQEGRIPLYMRKSKQADDQVQI